MTHFEKEKIVDDQHPMINYFLSSHFSTMVFANMEVLPAIAFALLAAISFQPNAVESLSSIPAVEQSRPIQRIGYV